LNQLAFCRPDEKMEKISSGDEKNGTFRE